MNYERDSRIYELRQEGKTLMDIASQYRMTVRRVAEVLADEKRRRTADALSRAFK